MGQEHRNTGAGFARTRAAASPVRASRAYRGSGRDSRRAAGALPLAPCAASTRPRRRPRTHRHAVVARRWRIQDAQLFPRRGFGRRAVLALSRGALRRGTDPALVPAWTLAVSVQYAELSAISNFSFLRGGSHPEELIVQAKGSGLSAIGLADRNSVAGLVRAHSKAKEDGLRFLPGTRRVFADGTPAVLSYRHSFSGWPKLPRRLTFV